MRKERSRSRYATWLHRQPFVVRWLVLIAMYAALLGAFNAAMFALGQGVDWSRSISTLVILPLLIAIFNTWRPHASMRRRFPRVYEYFEGFQNKPDPRLARFKRAPDAEA